MNTKELLTQGDRIEALRTRLATSARLTNEALAEFNLGRVEPDSLLDERVKAMLFNYTELSAYCFAQVHARALKAPDALMWVALGRLLIMELEAVVSGNPPPRGKPDPQTIRA